MTAEEIRAVARARKLEALGAFHPGPEDGLPHRIGTLVLLGPLEPGFWHHVTGEPEFSDGAPDALDRWSRRAVGAVARTLGAEAYFPFGGPPHRPFVAWAKATGRAWESEVGLLVHDQAGLLVSYRGAIGFAGRLALPPPGARPCDTCREKPCRSACPVAALDGAGYDISACKAYLDSEDGFECMERGCAVRRACPVSRTYGRLPEQSAYHMRHFKA